MTAQAELVVDLGVLAENLERVRATVAPAELMLVVKDDAYGHGLAPVVRTALRRGVRWFGAFDVRTAAAVRREAGALPRIFVWIAAARDDLDAAVAAALDVGVGDAVLLEELAESARCAGSRARVHLKIDTGLHRNGVRPEHWSGFVARAAELEVVGDIEVVGVWSHIAEASDSEDDAARQIYDRAVAQAQAAGLSPSLRHLAASAASFARPEFRYDLVRVGAFCYGIRSAGGPEAGELGLTPIAKLRAPAVSVDRDGVTIGIGSREGIPSVLAGRVVAGTPAGAREVRRIGAHLRVALWPDAAVGDVVTVFGPGDDGEPTATALAESIGTIGEEIVLRVSPLVARRYEGD